MLMRTCTVFRLAYPRKGKNWKAKEPDASLMVEKNGLPSVVVEVGTSETLPNSQNDMKQGLLGGDPQAWVVIAVKWYTNTNNFVRGLKNSMGISHPEWTAFGTQIGGP